MRCVVWVSCVVLATGGLARAQAEPDTDPSITNEEVFGQLRALSEGTQIWLQDVVVRGKSGNVLSVGDRHHRVVFVVPIDPSSLQFLPVGSHVDVRGTLRKSPGAAQAKLLYAMDAATARRLARQPLYVDAWFVGARP